MKPLQSPVEISSPSKTPPPLAYKEKYNTKKLYEENDIFKDRRIPNKNASNKSNASTETNNSFAPVYSVPKRSNHRRHSVAEVQCETDKKESLEHSNSLFLKREMTEIIFEHRYFQL